MHKMRPFQLILSMVFLMASSSCVKKGCTDPDALNYSQKAQRDDESCRYGDRNAALKTAIVLNHADIAFALYTDALAKAIALKTSTTSFLNAPTEDGFEALRQAWRTAHFYYLQCEALRFSNGPIDDDKAMDRQLDAWPIQATLIDYTYGSYQGIVNDTSIIKNISIATIAQQNEKTGEGQITAGFHVVEFLLWGQDSVNSAQSNAGSRSFLDFSLTDTNTINAKRRRQYLGAAVELIVSQLGILSNEWDAASGTNYRQRFLNLESDKALKNILTGLGTLCRAEMADRALLVPINANNPKLEISDFSDNSYSDLIAMNNSLSIIYTGVYESETALTIEGSSLSDLTAILDADLKATIVLHLEETKESIAAIPQPFDWQLKKESLLSAGPIHTAASSLNELEAQFKALAYEIGFGLQTDLPE